jgi:pyrimidine deaminase RibD-like protein
VIDRTNGELDPADRNSERPALAKALAAARVRQVPIVVAKVDRLTRSVGFLSMLLDAGVDVRFADLPQIEGTAGRFMLKLVSVTAWTCNHYGLASACVARRPTPASSSAMATDRRSPPARPARRARRRRRSRR